MKKSKLVIFIFIISVYLMVHIMGLTHVGHFTKKGDLIHLGATAHKINHFSEEAISDNYKTFQYDYRVDFEGPDFKESYNSLKLLVGEIDARTYSIDLNGQRLAVVDRSLTNSREYLQIPIPVDLLEDQNKLVIELLDDRSIQISERSLFLGGGKTVNLVYWVLNVFNEMNYQILVIVNVIMLLLLIFHFYYSDIKLSLLNIYFIVSHLLLTIYFGTYIGDSIFTAFDDGLLIISFVLFIGALSMKSRYILPRIVAVSAMVLGLYSYSYMPVSALDKVLSIVQTMLFVSLVYIFVSNFMRNKIEGLLDILIQIGLSYIFWSFCKLRLF